MKTLIIAEHSNEKLKTLTLNSITAASKISEDIDAIVIGHSIDGAVEELKSCEKLKKIFAVDHELFKNQLAEPMSLYLKEFLKDSVYTHILAPSSTFGKNLMPKVATYLDVQQISDISNIIDGDIFERPIYAGNAIAKVKSNDNVKVITVRSTCFEPCKIDANNVEVVKSEIELNNELNVNFVGYELSKSDRPELTAAKIIISGGRGMQNGDNFKLLEGIADKLGAAMGASRAAVDAGFVPNDWQVGQTGKIVAPDLYIAVGISGAIQHIAGIKDSKVIASINKDEEAPIFKFSDYGLVADLFEALPQLENKLK
jgi:electron transfer flavoprotein alpha subunit